MDRRTFMRGLAASTGILLLHNRAWGSAPRQLQAPWKPAYLKLEEAGRFAGRIEAARELYRHCTLCPRRCGVDRPGGSIGFCRSPGGNTVVYSRQPHFGEELPLVGRHGSGTIFLSHCNLRCVFCQNWPISHEGRGRQASHRQLATMMLDLQRLGCHNINLVTPTHIMPDILSALRIAMGDGLRLPLCYNTSGYDSLAAVELLDGIVDIYLPDLKFMDGEEAERYAGTARDYPETARAAIKEMQRQVGVLQTDEQGIARRGLMIRHLVMPNRVAGTREFVDWVARELPRDTYINIMAQYRVDYRAFEHPRNARAISADEFIEAIGWAEAAGLTRLDQRSLAQRDIFRQRR